MRRRRRSPARSKPKTPRAAKGSCRLASRIDDGRDGSGAALSDDETKTRGDDGRFEDRDVARGVGAQHQRAEARSLEESLENDGTAEQCAELRGNDDGDWGGCDRQRVHDPY